MLNHIYDEIEKLQNQLNIPWQTPYILACIMMLLTAYFLHDQCLGYLNGSPDKPFVASCQMILELEQNRMSVDYKGYEFGNGTLQFKPTNITKDTIEQAQPVCPMNNLTIIKYVNVTQDCPPPRICPDCICSCPICTKTACPTCEPDYEMLLHEINSWRPTGAPAVQHGWFNMRNQIRELLGGKASKFREGPSISYQPITSKEEDVYQLKHDEKGCFTLSQTPDINGRKRWNWNKNQCSGSNITICHL